MVRVFQIAVLALFCLSLMGCPEKSHNNFPDNLKVTDLAALNPDGSSSPNILKAISLDLHVLEIPEENFSKLNEIRRTLSIRPIKFNNYLAFSDNAFSVYYGKNQLRRAVYDLLAIAGAQHVVNQGIILIENESNNISIQQLPQMQLVYFNNLKGDIEAARIGPGYISMNVGVKKANSLDDAATVSIIPIFNSMSNNIPQFNRLQESRDFEFKSAAFQLDMIPGDFFLLAPERHTNDMSKLSGLFFSNPAGSIFEDSIVEGKPLERKPSIRIYVMTCIGLNL